MAAKVRTIPSVRTIKNVKERDISIELKDSAVALEAARENMEATQATYHLAFRRFEIAHEYLDNLVRRYTPEGDLETITDWMLSYHDLMSHAYTALSLGAAIAAVLEHEPDDEPLSLVEIEFRLDRGGFRFRTGSPRREINAALLKLSGIARDKAGKYWIDRAARGGYADD